MKKKLLLLLFALSSCNFLWAAEDSGLVKKVNIISEDLNALKKGTDDLKDSVKILDDSLKKLSNILSGELIVDSADLAKARSNPKEVLYKELVFSKRHLKWGDWLTLVAAFVLLFGMWYYGIKYFTDDTLCRDESYWTNGVLKTDPVKIPYSYSRVQLFWWTMIILSCYIIFYGFTGQLLPLNPTSVILLGCGVMVTVGAKIIDNRQITTNGLGGRHQDASTSQGVFKDILSDDSGISMHRFQAVVFNLVFGVAYVSYFITSIYNLRYPLTDFTEWQFALIGISSAGYLALKANENNNDLDAKKEPVQTSSVAQNANPGPGNEDESNSAQHDK